MDLCDVSKNAAQYFVIEQPVTSNEPNILQQPIEEMLGSVTTYNNLDGSDVFGSSKNCQQLRTSARVFKKMKLDNALAITSSPIIDKEKKDVNTDTKTEVKKPFRPLWSAEDKDIFFEALNEYGKDFDAIQQHINTKFKKKGLPDSQIKTKDQVRHFYYRTWHKVSKHLKFSEDIKKIAQELYALINYGELRKKVGSVSEKTCLKLNELIYRGTVAIRVKGKTIRIKTPMCRALRKLNQLDEKHEDLKLPTRVLVELRPKNMDTWLNVQLMSQNPRIRVSLTLQRRLSALLSCINERWKSHIAKAHETVHGFANATSDCTPVSSGVVQGPWLHFTPRSSSPVELPTINLSEYLTSHRICLNAYEERIGVKIPGEQLWQTMCASFKTGNKSSMRRKRQRNESTGEKLVNKKDICDDLDSDNPMTVSDVVDTAINTILALQSEQMAESDVVKREIKIDNNCQTDTLEPATKEEEIRKIQSGWTLQNCGTLTIGEMYLMFGHDSKLELEYFWDPPNLKTEPKQESIPTKEKETKTSNELSLALKKLVSLAKLHYRKERIRCPCGHICGGPSKTNSTTRNKSVVNKSNQRTENVNLGNLQTNCMRNVTVKTEPMFRKPAIYPSNGGNSDSFKAQLDSLQRMRPKYTNRKGRPVRSKHVVVERMLPLLPKPLLNGHSLVTMKVISQSNDLKSKSKLRPIAPAPTPAPAPRIEEPTVENKTGTDLVESGFFSAIELQNCEAQTQIENKDEMEEERHISSPTSISNFLDLDMSSTDTNLKDSLTSFAGLLSDDLPDSSTPLSSPSRILKENDNQWLNSEVNDYSLTSLLGHLESPMKTTPAIISCDDAPISQDIDSQFPALLGENGVDFVDQFVDMAAQVDTEPNEIGQLNH